MNINDKIRVKYIGEDLVAIQTGKIYDVIAIEKPKLLSNAIKLLIVNSLQTKDQINKGVNIPKQDLLVLSNLPLDYLDENIDLKIKQKVLNINDFKLESNA